MGTDLAAYVDTLRRAPDLAAARPLLAAPPAGVGAAVLDEDAAVAVLSAEPGVLPSALAGLGAATEATPLPSAWGPLRATLYPAGPPATVAVYGDPLVAAVAVRWPARGPVGDLRIDGDTGRITLCRRTVGPDTSRFAADALGGRWRDMRTGWAWLEVEHEVPGGGTWFTSLGFEGDRLVRVSLALLGEDESRGWDTWTRESEEAARERHDAWLDAALGRSRGRDGWNCTFGWGRVWSVYDERAGGSDIGIAYGQD